MWQHVWVEKPEDVDRKVEGILNDKPDFGMYTTAGNKSIRNKFRTLCKKLEDDSSAVSGVRACTAFLRSYRRMERTKSYAEYSDTDVRESVWLCFEFVCKKYKIDSDWLWVHGDSYPKKKRS